MKKFLRYLLRFSEESIAFVYSRDNAYFETERKKKGNSSKNDWFVGLRPILGLWDLDWKCTPWGSFYVILVRIYASFGENHGILQMAMSTSSTAY